MVIIISLCTILLLISDRLFRNQITYGDEFNTIGFNDGPAMMTRNAPTSDNPDFNSIVFHDLFPGTACLIKSDTCAMMGFGATENLL